MTTQHIPGPWYLEGHNHKLGYAVSAELRDSEPVAFVKSIHDARLIAAAPDLLESAHAAKLALDDLLHAKDGREWWTQRDAAIKLIDAAIAKATGAA